MGGGESGVLCVYEQGLLEQPPAAEQPRPHRAHGHVEDPRRVVVLEILQVHENHRRSEHLGQCGQRPADGRPRIDAKEGVFQWTVAHGLVHQGGLPRLELGCVERHLAVGAHAAVEKLMAADGEQPGAALGAGRELMPGAIRAQVGVVHEIVGVGLVAGEREREARHVGETAHRLLLKLPVAIARGRGVVGHDQGNRGPAPKVPCGARRRRAVNTRPALLVPVRGWTARRRDRSGDRGRRPRGPGCRRHSRHRIPAPRTGRRGRAAPGAPCSRGRP